MICLKACTGFEISRFRWPTKNSTCEIACADTITHQPASMEHFFLTLSTRQMVCLFRRTSMKPFAHANRPINFFHSFCAYKLANHCTNRLNLKSLIRVSKWCLARQMVFYFCLNRHLLLQKKTCGLNLHSSGVYYLLFHPLTGLIHLFLQICFHVCSGTCLICMHDSQGSSML